MYMGIFFLYKKAINPYLDCYELLGVFEKNFKLC